MLDSDPAVAPGSLSDFLRLKSISLKGDTVYQQSDTAQYWLLEVLLYIARTVKENYCRERIKSVVFSCNRAVSNHSKRKTSKLVIQTFFSLSSQSLFVLRIHPYSITSRDLNFQRFNSIKSSNTYADIGFAIRLSPFAIRFFYHTFPAVDDGIADLINESGLWDEPQGIEKIAGRCVNATDNRRSSDEDYAFRINRSPEISVQTRQLFPRNFPQDFSLLFVVRPPKGKTEPI